MRWPLGLDTTAAMLGESRRDLARQRLAVKTANPELPRTGAGEAGGLRRGDHRHAPCNAEGATELQATFAAEGRA